MTARRLFIAACVTISTLTTACIAAALPTGRAEAANEVYAWKDAQTITVTGPDLTGPSDLVLVRGGTLTGDQAAEYRGVLNYKYRGCTILLSVFTYKSPPYSANDGITKDRDLAAGPTSVGQERVTCLSVNRSLDDAIDNKAVHINGTKPTGTDAPETAEQKQVTIGILAPDPLVKAPKTVTITIKQNGVPIPGGVQTVPVTAATGPDSGHWPPEQTPASGSASFSLDPGTYQVCDNYVIPQCATFTKVRYTPLGLTYGKQYETPDKLQIRVHVAVHKQVPCGTPITVSPRQVEITMPDGTKTDQTTGPGQFPPSQQDKDSWCTADEIAYQNTTFEGMPPGIYTVCAVGGDKCEQVTKDDGFSVDVTIQVNDTPEGPPDQQVCSAGDGIVGFLTWIICPAVDLVARASTFFENNIIVPFLTVPPLTTNQPDPTYILWQDIRDVADVAFIVFFLVVAFSHATSLGIRTYGIKHVLPRLLVAVVALNVSYFLVAFAVDASNVLGAGISQLVTAALSQAGATQLNSGTGPSKVASVFVLGGAALGGIVVTGGAALGWFVSFLVLALLVIVVTVIVLVVRQVALIVLVVVAPLAILASLLPNTEGYFTKWRGLLTRLLLMYPLIVLLFASGKIFGAVLQQPDFQIGGDGVTNDVGQAVRIILQFIAYVVPLTLLPATFAASGAILGRAYAFLYHPAVRRPAQTLRDNVIAPRLAEVRLRAARRGGLLGQVAGRPLRRDFAREQRQRERDHARQEYIAAQLITNASLRQAAAGVGGQAGATRAQATAVSAREHAHREAIANELVLLTHHLQDIGVSTREFNSGLNRYLDNPLDSVIAGTARDARGQRGALDLAQHPELLRAAVYLAAREGRALTLEKARAAGHVDQATVDDAIRDNDAALKAAGGYHLATDFDLAHGRAATDIQGAPIDYRDAARARDQLEGVLLQQRLIAMSSRSSTELAALDPDVLEDSARLLDPALNPRAADVRASLSVAQQNALRQRLTQALEPQTLAKSHAPDAIRSMAAHI